MLNGGGSKPAPPTLGIVVPRRDEDDEGDGDGAEEIRTPIRPSAKALGKRRVVEAEEPDRKFFARLTFDFYGIIMIDVVVSGRFQPR